jgi:hypothetical protein
VLGFGLTKKWQYTTKLTEILYGFLNFLNFSSKFKGVSLRFYLKMPLCDKNWVKHRISYSWSPYPRSVIHNGLFHKFLRLLKFSNFGSKSGGGRLQFYRKHQFTTKTDIKSIFLDREVHILDQLYVMVLYITFLDFNFFSNFDSKSTCVSFQFY